MHIAPRIVTSRAHIAAYFPRIAGVPDLRVWQDQKRKMKQKKTAGVVLETFLDFQRWAQAHFLPDSFDEMAPFTTYAIPMDWTQYLGTEAVALTVHIQVGNSADPGGRHQERTARCGSPPGAVRPLLLDKSTHESHGSGSRFSLHRRGNLGHCTAVAHSPTSECFYQGALLPCLCIPHTHRPLPQHPALTTMRL